MGRRDRGLWTRSPGGHMQQGDAGQDSLRQLAALNRIARIALEDLDLGPMLQRIVDTLHEEFGWEFIAFARVDRERGEFCCEALHSEVDTAIAAGYRRALGSGVVGECAMTGTTLDIEDTEAHPNFVDTLPGTRSELCVPIRHHGEVLAVLLYSRRTAEIFARLAAPLLPARGRAGLSMLCLSEAVASPLVDAHFVRIALAEHPSEEAMMALALSVWRDHNRPGTKNEEVPHG